eukprot:2294282-Rhodomonas_salina.2
MVLSDVVRRRSALTRRGVGRSWRGTRTQWWGSHATPRRTLSPPAPSQAPAPPPPSSYAVATYSMSGTYIASSLSFYTLAMGCPLLT